MTVTIHRWVEVSKTRFEGATIAENASAAAIRLGLRFLRGVRIRRVTSGTVRRRGGLLARVARGRLVPVFRARR